MEKDPLVYSHDWMMVYLLINNLSLFSKRFEVQKERELNVDTTTLSLLSSQSMVSVRIIMNCLFPEVLQT